MEHWIPSEVPLAGLKRLLLDRLLFAPAFLLLFFLIMNFLEVRASRHHAEPEGASSSSSLVSAWADRRFSLCPESVAGPDLDSSECFLPTWCLCSGTSTWPLWGSEEDLE
ncbi:peroxisomal membrane protein 2 isoform X1 [Leptonychotes weddellii]|uniref:Peroxisomal membrane protein 2 isoform X1 n=1 Tax=Leptonychotes weddellii TaxID=9713 RepID=A0A7F8RWM7_LEPWE|nr:peroxisomal membrane protein 2 isoform X1 [Leptonychotes weddellii]